LTGSGAAAPGAVTTASGRLRGLAAITFDFGNTLVRVDRAGLGRVVEVTAEAVCARGGIADRVAFLAAWAEERERQFREELPRFREVDLAQRVSRVLARFRGVPAPPANVPWDDVAAAACSTPDDITHVVEVYSRAFVAGLPPAPEAGALLARLRARGLRLAILSNWPLAATIDTYAEASGWLASLDAIVVSQRVGAIKPHAAIFAAAAAAVGDPGRRPSCTLATIGPPTWSAPGRLAGGPRTCTVGRTTRRCRRATAMRRPCPTSSCGLWASWNRTSDEPRREPGATTA